MVRYEHFLRAAEEIGAHGDNDTLPFDPDVRFVKDRAAKLARFADTVFHQLDAKGVKGARTAVDALSVFSERLLVPTGPAGFRVSTKIHPFWNLYLNGLGIAIAEVFEPQRSSRVASYRFVNSGIDLFDRTKSWRMFREAGRADCTAAKENAVVVQSDISAFYEHVSHHRLENRLEGLVPNGSTVPTQIDRFLSKMAAGRSFGLPVGGQCARILAEVLLASVDQQLTDANVKWRRYVDDYFFIAEDQAAAYRALGFLAHALADYGLTLNRTKTTFLTARHYVEYVSAQLDRTEDDAGKLLEIDLYYDPYSDTPIADYQQLQEAVEGLNIRALLNVEIRKGQPDTFLIAQIGRALKFQPPKVAIELCETLLSPTNLTAFRASLSAIWRGVAAIRDTAEFSVVFEELDKLLDVVPDHSAHLLQAESSALHYLRAIRFTRTDKRAQFIHALYAQTQSVSIKRACIDCWRQWKDSASFTRERNRWNVLGEEEKRMLWIAAAVFGDEGRKFRQQVAASAESDFRVGIEKQGTEEFAGIFFGWANDVAE